MLRRLMADVRDSVEGCPREGGLHLKTVSKNELKICVFKMLLFVQYAC
jgi:hypothetical protein